MTHQLSTSITTVPFKLIHYVSQYTLFVAHFCDIIRHTVLFVQTNDACWIITSVILLGEIFALLGRYAA
jgi:hypothetical protein